MAQTRLLVLVIVGACTITVGAASASAEAPSFSTYPDKFTGSFKTAKLNVIGGAVVSCNKGTLQGEVTEAKVMNAFTGTNGYGLVFRECSYETKPCEDFAISVGLGNVYPWNLGYINSAHTKNGVAFAGEGEGRWAFYCGTRTVRVDLQGSQVATVRKVSASVLRLTFAAPKGKTSPNKLACGTFGVETEKSCAERVNSFSTAISGFKEGHYGASGFAFSVAIHFEHPEHVG